MTKLSSRESAEQFAHGPVPHEATGSALTVFFIVAGVCFGLPVFILASLVVSGLGLKEALLAFCVGTVISGALASVSVYVGSRTHLSLALLAKLTFGLWGGQAVRILLAISLIGWFAVVPSLFGATSVELIHETFGVGINSSVISVPLIVIITLVVLKGVVGLERLARVVVPCAIGLLLVALYMTLHRVGSTETQVHGLKMLTFGGAVSAIVGSYTVGIVVQPDYGRFVRHPRRAAIAAFTALGVVYPISLTLSALPMALLGQQNVILAMALLGIGFPALIVFLLAAWMDASGSLYSGCLALSTLFSKVHYRIVVTVAGCVGALLAVAHVDRYYIPFLQLLSVALPPVAAIQCYVVLVSFRGDGSRWLGSPRLRWAAVVAWVVGAVAGLASERGLFRLTDISALDSVICALAVMIGLGWLRLGSPHHAPTVTRRSPGSSDPVVPTTSRGSKGAKTNRR